MKQYAPPANQRRREREGEPRSRSELHDSRILGATDLRSPGCSQCLGASCTQASGLTWIPSSDPSTRELYPAPSPLGFSRRVVISTFPFSSPSDCLPFTLETGCVPSFGLSIRAWNTGPVLILILCLQASGLFSIVTWLPLLFQGLVSSYRVSAEG